MLTATPHDAARTTWSPEPSPVADRATNTRNTEQVQCGALDHCGQSPPGRGGFARSVTARGWQYMRELRLVVTADDYDAAVAFYRDVLGLDEQAAFSSPGGRVTILEAGRATLEIADPPHADYIDEVEVGRRVAGHIRVAFAVDDVPATTDQLVDAGAELVADADAYAVGVAELPAERARSACTSRSSPTTVKPPTRRPAGPPARPRAGRHERSRVVDGQSSAAVHTPIRISR